MNALDTPPQPPRPINLAREADFRLGGALVRPSTREVIAGGRREPVEPRVMQVLVALARRQGEVVSRDELIASCWGGRFVGEDAINRCIGQLRKLGQRDRGAGPGHRYGGACRLPSRRGAPGRRNAVLERKRVRRPRRGLALAIVAARRS